MLETDLMNSFNREYWDKRANEYGHTGHSEPFYYCFDQQARLYVISELLKKIELNKFNALDFGCGSGDFSKLLSKHFKSVFAYDISEKVLATAELYNKAPNIIYSKEINESDFSTKFDLIISITVLQTQYYEDIEKNLKSFKQILAPKGKLIFMESFPSAEMAKNIQNKVVTNTEWFKLLNTNNYKIIKELNFYNPIVKPVKSWKRYKYNFLLQALKPFKKLKIAQDVYKNKAITLIKKHQDVILNEESPIKIYILEI